MMNLLLINNTKWIEREKKSTIYIFYLIFLMNCSNWLTGFIRMCLTWIWNIRTPLPCSDPINNNNYEKKTNKTTACKKYTNYKTHTSLKIIKRCAVLILAWKLYATQKEDWETAVFAHSNFFTWISDFYLHMIIYVKNLI